MTKLFIATVALITAYPVTVTAQTVTNKPRPKPPVSITTAKPPATVPSVKPPSSATPVKLDKMFDFKGVPLGITLAEFRALPHPDGRPAKVVCTGEKVGEMFYPTEPVDVMLFSDIEKAAGVIKCIWVNVSNGKVLNSFTSGLDLATSGYVAVSYHFNFIKDPLDNEFRLYEFSGTSNRNATDNVIAALTGKWGPPVLTRSAVQNKMGASFEQITAQWESALSQIKVQDRWSKIDDLHISVLHKKLFQVIVASEAERRAKKQNPI